MNDMDKKETPAARAERETLEKLTSRNLSYNDRVLYTFEIFRIKITEAKKFVSEILSIFT